MYPPNNRCSVIPITLSIWLISLSSFLFALEEDRLQQIDIEADEATFNENQGLTTYRGNVILSQGSLEVKADTMLIRQTVTQQLKDIKAEGASSNPVTLKQQVAARDGSIEWVNARSHALLYDMKLNLVEFIGDANIKKGEATIQSEHIKYDATQGIFEARNNASDAKNTDKNSSRVRISLPPQTEQSSPEATDKNKSSDK